jgi:cytidylate kinase
MFMTYSSLAPVITVDGPSASGKGTVSALLARELGWHHLDSGSLYRVLALAADSHKVSLDDELHLATLVHSLDVKFVISQNSLMPEVILEGINVTESIRTESCGKKASIVGALSKVREALVGRQRVFREPPGLVTDGRDMGSVIFPDAGVKIFLSATPEERARRRHLQLKNLGINVSLDTLCVELIERDRRDQDRAVAPLKPAVDAQIIDTTHLTIDEVLHKIKQIAHAVYKIG